MPWEDYEVETDWGRERRTAFVNDRGFIIPDARREEHIEDTDFGSYKTEITVDGRGFILEQNGKVCFNKREKMDYFSNKRDLRI